MISWLAILLHKSENDIVNIIKKPHNFVGKTKNYLKNPPKDLEKLHPDFSEDYQKIIRKLLENDKKIISISKVNFHLTMGVFVSTNKKQIKILLEWINLIRWRTYSA